MQELEERFHNRFRRKKLKELRSQLPARCEFGPLISQRLKNKNVEVEPYDVYMMLSGHKKVLEEVLDEMQNLVNESIEALA